VKKKKHMENTPRAVCLFSLSASWHKLEPIWAAFWLKPKI
jgi:hypothetical protein